MAFVNRKWDPVTRDRFNTGKYLAHEDFAQTVRSVLGTKDKLKGLIKEHEKNLMHLHEDGEEAQEDDDHSEEEAEDDLHSNEELNDTSNQVVSPQKREPH